MSEFTIPIPARLKNVAINGHVAGTEDIIDDALGKTQKDINTETSEKIEEIKGGSTDSIASLKQSINNEKERAESVEEGLSNRLSDVEQLAEISLNGGEAKIATGEDFNNPTAEQRVKIPTVGAVLDGADDIPTAGSEKLVKSGGVAEKLSELEKEISGYETKIVSGTIHSTESKILVDNISIYKGLINLGISADKNLSANSFMLQIRDRNDDSIVWQDVVSEGAWDGNKKEYTVNINKDVNNAAIVFYIGSNATNIDTVLTLNYGVRSESIEYRLEEIEKLQLDRTNGLPAEDVLDAFVNKEGQLVTTDIFNVFIFNVTDCKKVSVTSVTGGGWNAFYDKDDSLIGEPFRVGNLYTETTIEKDVPVGAVAMKCTHQRSASNYICVKGVGSASVANLKKSISGNEKNINDINTRLYGQVKLFAEKDGYINAVSPYELRPSASGAKTCFYSVDNLKSIIIHSNSGIVTGNTFAFFGSTTDYSVALDSNNHIYDSNGDTSVVVPSGAKVVGITSTFKGIGNPSNIAVKSSDAITVTIEKLEASTTRLDGLTIDFEGDSITYARAADNGVGFARAAKEMGMNWVNNGSSGASTTTVKDNSICTLVQSRGKYDYMIVQPSTVNDPNSVELGSLSSDFKPISENYDTTTYYGALEQIARHLVVNQNKCGMLICYKCWGDASKSCNTVRPQAIRDVCEKWSIPYLDLNKCAGFNLIHPSLIAKYGRYDGSVSAYDESKGYAEDEQVKYLSSLYKANERIPAPAGTWNPSKWTKISDGSSNDTVHCNDVAYELMKNKIKEFIKSL